MNGPHESNLFRERAGVLRTSLLVLATLPGCGDAGPQRVAVTGEVRVDGRPLPRGTISFRPVEGGTGPTVVAPIEDGRFHVAARRGPAVGRYRAVVTDFAADAPLAGGAATPTPLVPSAHSERTVELRRHADNRFDWDLQR